MNMWHNSVLMAPAGEFSGGGGNEDVEDEVILFDDEGGNEGGEETAKGAQAPGVFDPNVLSQAMANAMKQVMPQREEPTQNLSEEEFAKLTKKFVPDENVARAFFGEGVTPQQTEALKSLVSGIYNHLYTATGMVLKGELDGVRSQLTPLQEQIAEQRASAFAADVVKSVPALKPYGALVRGAMNHLRSSGWRPNGATQQEQLLETKKTIARLVEAQVKQYNPEFSLSGNAAVSAGGRAGMPRMAGMSGGGSGGSGGGAGGNKPNWQKVLGT